MKSNPNYISISTSQFCPVSGSWKSIEVNSITIDISEGQLVPSNKGKAIGWKLISEHKILGTKKYNLKVH